MKPKDYGLFFGVLSPLLSSMGVVLIAVAAKLLPPLFVASITGILGGIILFFSMFLFKEKFDLFQLKGNSKDLLKMLFVRGVFGAGIMTLGLSMTDGIKAIFFSKTEPFFVLGWHWLLLGEKIRKSHIILLTVHMTGAVILSTGGNFLAFGRTQLGGLFIIIAMMLFALSYIYGSRLSKSIGSRVPSAVTSGIGGLILLPISLFFVSSTVWDITSIGWVYMISFVILWNVFGLTFWFISLKTVKGWIVSALRSIGPIAGVPFAYFLFGETLNIIQIIGGIIVLITSALIAREHLRPKNSKSN